MKNLLINNILFAQILEYFRKYHVYIKILETKNFTNTSKILCILFLSLKINYTYEIKNVKITTNKKQTCASLHMSVTMLCIIRNIRK